jgi:hypothetical protein
MELNRCQDCDNEPFTHEDIQKKFNKGVYYVRGWRLFVFKLFMKEVMPRIVDGQRNHNKLIDAGHIVHALKETLTSPKV